MSKTH